MNYIIVGAGGFGREVFHALQCFLKQKSSSADDNDRIKGFLDDDLFALNGFSGYPPILCDINEYRPMEKEVLLLALGIPKSKRFVAMRLMKKNAAFTSLIHPDTNLISTQIGRGCYIGWHVVVSCEVTVKDFVSLNANITVGHDAVIEDYVEVGPGTAISGFVHIEEGVHIGSGCVIAPGVRVGAWSKISANSAVMRDVPPFSYVTGVPGTTIPDFFQHPDQS